MTDYDKLSKICKELLFKEPFYGLYLIMLDKVFSKSIPTACVSTKKLSYQLTINPDFWGGLPDEKKLGLLKHELLHCVFFHLVTAKDFTNKEIFNIAADIEINQYIDPKWLPEGGCTIDSFPELNLPYKAGTKKYYDLLLDAKNSGASETLNNLLDAMSQNLPKSADGLNNPNHDLWGESDDMSEVEQTLLKAQTQHVIQDIAESLKSRGTIPSEIEELLKGLATVEPPKFDWKGYLRRFIGNSKKTYTKKLKRKVNKRFDENPGLKIKMKQHILVAVDTSASVSTNELKEFFQEINHIHRTGVQITVIQADAAISDIRPYKANIEFSIHGRGGTSFDPVVDYYNNNYNKYTSLIYFTDGDAPSPEKPRNKMLWVLSSKSKMNNSLPGYVIKLN
jgi:predicted metal-dependent peptidase